MMNQKQVIMLLGFSCLYSCSTYNPSGYYDDRPVFSQKGTELYPEGYETTTYKVERPVAAEPTTVVVPDSYHVGTFRAPAKSKNVDHQWAEEQSASTYTIEVAHDEKASAVAKTLMDVPKTERRAELQYQNGGKTEYKGVYGTYPTKEAAEAAMRNLPKDIQQKASVQNWGDVKKNME